MVTLDALAAGESVNAALGWTTTAVLSLVAVRNALAAEYLWCGLALVAVGVTVAAPAAVGRWTVLPPWPLVVVTAAGIVCGSLGVYPEGSGYVAVAGLAVVIAVELDAYTAVEMSRRFAVGFAVLTTLAVQGLWIVAQFYSDRWLGTGFVETQRELQVDIVTVTVVGLAIGALFEAYLARFGRSGSPDRPTGASR